MCIVGSKPGGGDGAPFAMEAGFPVDACETSGATASYRSSKHFERRRCAACGTPCGAVHHKLGAIFLPTALFAKPGAPSPPPGFEPTMHIFYERRVVGDAFEQDGPAEIPSHAAVTSYCAIQGRSTTHVAIAPQSSPRGRVRGPRTSSSR